MMNFAKNPAAVRKIIYLLFFFTVCSSASAQKIEAIHFNLYTDSLKRGFYNYINVDGKLDDGTWMPLDSTHLTFISDGGFFRGNDLFVDSSFMGEYVRVKVILKSNPSLTKSIKIYIRKRGFDEPLKTDEEVLNGIRSEQKKKKKGTPNSIS
jgi:hypothetical protein